MPVDFEKLLEQERPQIENRLWIGTARISRRIPGKFELDEYGQLSAVDPYTGVRFIDVTTRGKHPLWAPGWDLVMGHKNGVISDEEYVETYTQVLRVSYRYNSHLWKRILTDAYQSQQGLILCCYCPPGKFCHRTILAEVLHKTCDARGIPVHLGGEWFQ